MLCPRTAAQIAALANVAAGITLYAAAKKHGISRALKTEHPASSYGTKPPHRDTVAGFIADPSFAPLLRLRIAGERSDRGSLRDHDLILFGFMLCKCSHDVNG